MSRRNRGRRAAAAASTRRLRNWVQRLTREELVQAAELPLRRDMVTVLTYVQEHQPKGTQSTGNFKLKDVRAITADFVEPPVLDRTIGDQTYKLRTEYDVWPLYFLHVLAEVGGLLEGREARRWHLTKSGAQFLSSPPPVQILSMLMTWWYRVNWLIAYPFAGMGERLPPDFEAITRAHLLALPLETRIEYEPFADGLIEEAGLTWTSQDTSFHRMFLHSAVQKMVIIVLEDFGALELAYGTKPLGKSIRKELVAFQIKPFGHELLKILGWDW